jgi:UDP-2,3-diacylglucosamine pyrophosphatase LpxH
MFCGRREAILKARDQGFQGILVLVGSKLNEQCWRGPKQAPRKVTRVVEDLQKFLRQGLSFYFMTMPTSIMQEAKSLATSAVKGFLNVQ